MTGNETPDPASRKPAPMEPLTSELNLRPTGGLPWLICIVLVVAFVWQYFTAKRESSPVPQTVVEQNSRFVEGEDHRMAQIPWRDLERRVKALATQQSDLVKTLNQRRQRLEELARSEAGRRIAAADDLLEQYATVAGQKCPDEAQLQNWNEAIEILGQNCKEALQDPKLLVEPSEKALQRTETLEKSVTESLSTATHNLAAVDVLVQRAAKNSPASTSLAEKLIEQERRRTAEHTAELTRQGEAVRRETEAQQKAQDLLAKRQRDANTLEQKRIADEMEALQAKAKTEREQKLLREAQDKMAAEKAHTELLRKFDKALPEIKSLLSPMISKGKMQIGGANWVAGEEGPVSLGALKRNKTLELTESGTYSLSGFFCGPLCKNDRPRSGFPDTIVYNETKIRRAQELLVEFGEILVEKGMLRP